jgi:hypothetical protein
MRWPVAVIALTLLLSPTAAAPEDKLGGAMDMTIGGALHTGEVADHATRKTMAMRVGGGVMRGPNALLVSFTFGMLSDLAEPTTGSAWASEVPTSFIELGAEPSIRRELTRGSGLRVHVRAGYRLRWLVTSSGLPRTCDFNGGCDGGYYFDSPTYRAHGPSAAIGLGFRSAGDTWAGFGAELAVTRATIERPGLNPDLGDTVISLGLNVAMGRGAGR